MRFIETKLKGAYVIELEKITDERGFFARIWCQREFKAHELNPNLAQSSVAFSKKKGTLRGMHYQRSPHEETKLVCCTKGAVYDVILDLRKNSSTFKEWYGIELTAENRKMVYVPEGFAHGYQTLVDDTEVLYFISEFYTPEAYSAVRWDDPAFNIKWPETDSRIVSDKDEGCPDFK